MWSARNSPPVELLAPEFDWLGEETIPLLLLLLSPAVILPELAAAATLVVGLTTVGDMMDMKSVRPVRAFCFSPLFQ